MGRDIVVPRLGESINEATIGQILKPSGSQVKVEEEILEIETDKVNQILYAPESGTLKLTVKTGQTVKIGDVIGTVETSTAAPIAPPPKPSQAVERSSPPSPPKAPPMATAARHTKADFIQGLQPGKQSEPPKTPTPPEPASKGPSETKSSPPASAEPASENPRETRRKMSRLRRVIAERLVEAQRTAAMLTTFNEVDMTQVIDLRTRYKESFAKRYGAKLGFMSFFVKAVVSALKDVPDLNSYIDGDEVVHRDYYDVGIAVGTDRGLIVPVLRDCDQLTFGQIEATLEALARKAREGGITVEELSGGGFTITNGGVYGSLLSTPILNPPQSGILGMHKIQDRPVVKEGAIVIRPMMYLALSYDHRLVDGKGAVKFLVHIKEFLEDPARLLIEI